MKTNNLIILFLLVLSIASCSYDSENDLIDVPNGEDPNEDPITTINYTDDIRPILQSSCVGCHASPPVNGAPFALTNYSQASQRAGAILNAMSRQSGTPAAMPPSGRLPQATIDLVQEWIDEGTPEN